MAEPYLILTSLVIFRARGVARLRRRDRTRSHSGPARPRRGALRRRSDVGRGRRVRRRGWPGPCTRSGSSTSSATASRPTLGRAVHDVAARFFALPEADRLAIENVRSAQFRGYTRFGHERTNGRVDLRDQIDIGRELPPPDLGPDDPAWLRLRGPNLWPAALPELRAVTTSWMEHLEALGQLLLGALARGLELPPDTFADAVSPPEVLLKVIRYVTPPDAGRRRRRARASAPTATPGSCRSSTRTTSAGCRSSATAR